MLRIEQNLPARSRKRGEAPIPRVKGVARVQDRTRAFPYVKEIARWTTRPHRRPKVRVSLEKRTAADFEVAFCPFTGLSKT